MTNIAQMRDVGGERAVHLAPARNDLVAPAKQREQLRALRRAVAHAIWLPGKIWEAE